MTLKRARIFLLNWTLAVLATVAAFVVHLALRGRTVSLGYELGKALLEVRETVRALGSLADFLERNPDALVYGIRRPAQNGR